MVLLRMCLFVIVLLVSATTPTHAESVVAVGNLYGAPRPEGGFESIPLVLRLLNGMWVPAASLPVSTDGGLTAVAFSGPTTLWALGSRTGSTIMWRSLDSGATWDDVTAMLPEELRFDKRLVAIAFNHTGAGWLLGATASSIGPYVAETRDSGSTWSSVEAGTPTIAASFGIGNRDGNADVLRDGLDGTSITTLNEDNVSVQTVAPEFAGFALATAGDRAWIVGAEPNSTEGTKDRPTIYTARQGDLWEKQAIPHGGRAILRTIHFRDSVAGLAGGWTVGERPELQPLCLTTDDGGVSWEVGGMPEGLDGMLVSSAVRTAGLSGWAVANNESAPGVAFLHTEDGGKTWQEILTPVDTAGRIWVLASSPEE